MELSQHLTIEELQHLEQERKNIKEQFLRQEHGKDAYLSLKRKICILKEQHMPLRIVMLAKQCWKKGRPLPKELNDKTLLPTLSPKSKCSKEDSKKYWKQVENELISLFAKEDPSIISILEKVTLVHGTNSAIIPFLSHTEYSLISTGYLIKFYKIAPMSGELANGFNGISQRFLSLESVRNLKRPWSYAIRTSKKNFKSEKFKNVEKCISIALEHLSNLNPLNLKDEEAWRREILFLMQLKQLHQDEYQECIKLYKGKVDEIKSNISRDYARQEKLLIAALQIPTEELRIAVRSSFERTCFEKKWLDDNGFSLLLNDWYALSGPDDFDSFLEFIAWDVLLKEDLNVMYALTHIIKMRLFGAEQLLNMFSYPNIICSSLVWKKLASDPVLKEKLPLEAWQKIYTKSKEPITNTSSPSFFTKVYRVMQNLLNGPPFSQLECEVIVNFVLDTYVREAIERRLNNLLFPLNGTLEQLDHLILPSSFQLSTKDLDLITNPFPLLLASTSHKLESRFEMQDEFSSRKIRFGKGGIDLIFVKKENLLQMHEWVRKHKLDQEVVVHEVTSIMEASERLPLYHSSTQIESVQGLFSRSCLSEVSRILDNQAKYLYQQPYPDGRTRLFHGIAHASRTAFWTYILASRFHTLDIQIEASKELLVLFAYLHDSGREDDGPDKKIWEEVSASYAEEIAQQVYPTKINDIPLLKEAVIGKDDRFSQEISHTKKIIHAADSLEILRCLRNVDDFRSEELWLSGIFAKEEIEELVTHARSFIALTEDPQLKKWLENCSSPFAALFQILEFAASLNPEKFSWLAHQASLGIDAFCTLPQDQLSQSERERIAVISSVR